MAEKVEAKKAKKAKKDVKTVMIQLSHEQHADLKKRADKDCRPMSNYVKSLLFVTKEA